MVSNRVKRVYKGGTEQDISRDPRDPFSIENEAQKEAETKRVGCIV